MATITGYTAERMKQIEDTTVVSGSVNTNGSLILATRAGSQLDAGHVVGPQGLQGPQGIQGIQGPQGIQAPLPPWQPSTAYTANTWILSPRGEVVKAKTNHTSGTTFNSAEALKWAGEDQSMTFTTSAAFNWSGGRVSWDAGPLVIDSSVGASSHASSPMPTHTSVGTASGTLKFNEPGFYDVVWWHLSDTDPGISGYRILTYGTWPGPISSQWQVLGQTYRPGGDIYWESMIQAIGIRVPTAGLEIRLVGIQTNGTSAFPKVRVRKASSI